MDAGPISPGGYSLLSEPLDEPTAPSAPLLGARGCAGCVPACLRPQSRSRQRWRSPDRCPDPPLQRSSRRSASSPDLELGSACTSAGSHGGRGRTSSSLMSNPSRRIQSLISLAKAKEKGGKYELEDTVLNRGLGALTARLVRRPEPWFSRAHVPLLLGAIVTMTSATFIHVHFYNLGTEDFLTTDPARMKAGLTRLAAMPLACASVNLLMVHIRRTTFWWELPVNGAGSSGRSSRRCCGIDRLSFWPMVLAAMALFRSAVKKLVNDESAATEIMVYTELGQSFILLWLYYALLDAIHAIIQGMKQEQEAINKTEPVRKMQNLISKITRTKRPEKDVVYCFAQTNTVPAEVLLYVWWVYYIGGKVLGAGIVACVLMGVEESVLEKMLIGGVMFSLATASGFLFELGPNTLSLLRLSLNKPFYVGDLVTLNTNGAMDSPGASIMGFVENITMMYVVVRNFEMKQTWIPHKTFSGMIIQNWTRRPSKTVKMSIGISCRCPVKKVQRLTAFGMKWIEKSPEIQQDNYRKCHVTKTANGFNIEIIFYPGIGVSHRGIRQKFLWSFMAAAQRMDIPFVPVQTMSNFPASGPVGAEHPSAGASEPRLSAIAEHRAVDDDDYPPPDFQLPPAMLQPTRAPQSGRASPAALASPELRPADRAGRGRGRGAARAWPTSPAPGPPATPGPPALAEAEAVGSPRAGRPPCSPGGGFGSAGAQTSPGGSGGGKLRFARYMTPDDHADLDDLFPHLDDMLTPRAGLRPQGGEGDGSRAGSAEGGAPGSDSQGRGATDICRTAEIDLSDLDNLLPDPNDLLTKGVGNGFRQYPEGVVPEKPSERLRGVSG